MNTKRNVFSNSAVDGADEVFFAGANTAKGFVSFYPEIFDERKLTKLYVIKGGPGSGKSTLLRRMIRTAKDAGLSTGAYLCGSDPLSLDAAVICGEGGTVAAIDATSPHPYDARYPGAVAEVVDCGAFWDVSALRSHREAIVALADAKGAAYREAYRWLGALGGVRAELRRLGENALDREKMRAACRRFALAEKGAAQAKSVRGASGSAALSPHQRCVRCFSMRGEAQIDVAPDYARVTVTNGAYAENEFFGVMIAELATAGIDAVRLVDCVEPDVTTGILIPSTRTKIVCAEATERAEKNFNLTRFLCRERLAETRNRRAFARKCAETLADGARRSLADAGECHFALEDVYVAAMDFDALTIMTDAVIDEAVALASGR